MYVETLLSIKGRLIPENSGTHISFPFVIDKPAKELRIEFSFSPDIMEDKGKARAIIREAFIKYTGTVDEEKVDNYLPMKNLLTISVDGPEKFGGTAHRHMAVQKLFINKDKATRGLLPIDIVSGEWKIILSVHAVATEYTDYSIRAEAQYD